EPFDDPNPRTKKDAVCFGASLEWSDRGTIDPNRTEPTRGEVAGGVRRNGHVVLEEQSRPTARRVSRLQQQSFALADAIRPKLVDIDAARISNQDDSRRTHRFIAP